MGFPGSCLIGETTRDALLKFYDYSKKERPPQRVDFKMHFSYIRDDKGEIDEQGGLIYNL